MLQVFDAPALSVAGGSEAGAFAEEKEKAEEKEAETMARAALESLAGRSSREVSRARLQQRPAEQGVDTESPQVEGKRAKVEQVQHRTAAQPVDPQPVQPAEHIADVPWVQWHFFRFRFRAERREGAWRWFFRTFHQKRNVRKVASESTTSSSSAHGMEYHIDLGAPHLELMDVYCSRFGLQSASVHFRLNAGDVTQLRCSARECGYENGDVFFPYFYDPDWV